MSELVYDRDEAERLIMETCCLWDVVVPGAIPRDNLAVSLANQLRFAMDRINQLEHHADRLQARVRELRHVVDRLADDASTSSPCASSASAPAPTPEESTAASDPEASASTALKMPVSVLKKMDPSASPGWVSFALSTLDVVPRRVMRLSLPPQEFTFRVYRIIVPDDASRSASDWVINDALIDDRSQMSKESRDSLYRYGVPGDHFSESRRPGSIFLAFDVVHPGQIFSLDVTYVGNVTYLGDQIPAYPFGCDVLATVLVDRQPPPPPREDPPLVSMMSETRRTPSSIHLEADGLVNGRRTRIVARRRNVAFRVGRIIVRGTPNHWIVNGICDDGARHLPGQLFSGSGGVCEYSCASHDPVGIDRAFFMDVTYVGRDADGGKFVCDVLGESLGEFVEDGRR
jgi:hypothetical protein